MSEHIVEVLVVGDTWWAHCQTCKWAGTPSRDRQVATMDALMHAVHADRMARDIAEPAVSKEGE